MEPGRLLLPMIGSFFSMVSKRTGALFFSVMTRSALYFKTRLLTAGLTFVFLLLSSCKGWIMDYRRPAAQFEARNAIALAPDYLRKQVTIRGRVSGVDTSDPERCLVKLEHGVTAHFGKSKVAAESYEVGEVIHLSGIVEAVNPSGITLDPAFGRDSKAPFAPLAPAP